MVENVSVDVTKPGARSNPVKKANEVHHTCGCKRMRESDQGGCIVRSLLFEVSEQAQRVVAVKVKAEGGWNPRGERACNFERNEEASWLSDEARSGSP